MADNDNYGDGDSEPMSVEELTRLVDRERVMLFAAFDAADQSVPVRHYMTRAQYDYLTTIGVTLPGDIVIDDDEFEDYEG